MKTIEEVNFSDYRCFFLTEETNPFDIKIYTKIGYQSLPSDRYDLIQTSAGILVGYKADLSGFQNHMYETNEKKKYIQLILFEKMQDIINGEKIGNFDFYAFFDSVYISPGQLYETSEEELKDVNGNVFKRCDVDKFGGKVFYPVTNNYNIINIRPVIDIAGIGHVTYFNTTNTGNVNMYSRTKNTSARTFTGIIKVLMEWAQSSEEPFNNMEPPALKAKQILEGVNLSQDLIDWVQENQIDMPVARYLKGETDMGIVHQENEEMPEPAKDFLKTNCLYKNIASIKKNHPRGYLIEDHFLEKEKKYLENQLYQLYISDILPDLETENVENYLNSINESITQVVDLKALYFNHKEN